MIILVDDTTHKNIKKKKTLGLFFIFSSRGNKNTWSLAKNCPIKLFHRTKAQYRIAALNFHKKEGAGPVPPLAFNRKKYYSVLPYKFITVWNEDIFALRKSVDRNKHFRTLKRKTPDIWALFRRNLESGWLFHNIRFPWILCHAKVEH